MKNNLPNKSKAKISAGHLSNLGQRQSDPNNARPNRSRINPYGSMSK